MEFDDYGPIQNQASVAVSRELQRRDKARTGRFDSAHARTDPRGEHNSTLRANPRAVLIIDDDRELCQMIDVALNSIGCAVRATGFGADAVRLATGQAFDLMLIDLQLPDMLGTQVMRALHDAAVEVPLRPD